MSGRPEGEAAVVATLQLREQLLRLVGADAPAERCRAALGHDGCHVAPLRFAGLRAVVDAVQQIVYQLVDRRVRCGYGGLAEDLDRVVAEKLHLESESCELRRMQLDRLVLLAAQRKTLRKQHALARRRAGRQYGQSIFEYDAFANAP